MVSIVENPAESVRIMEELQEDPSTLQDWDFDSVYTSSMVDDSNNRDSQSEGDSSPIPKDDWWKKNMSESTTELEGKLVEDKSNKVDGGFKSPEDGSLDTTKGCEKSPKKEGVNEVLGYTCLINRSDAENEEIGNIVYLQEKKERQSTLWSLHRRCITDGDTFFLDKEEEVLTDLDEIISSSNSMNWTNLKDVQMGKGNVTPLKNLVALLVLFFEIHMLRKRGIWFWRRVLPMVKIMSLNINGVGTGVKRSWIKSLGRKTKCNFVCL